ncbi:MAG: FAD-dependent oxidoreductase, partial [Gemmatimonadota bacterium]
RFDTRVVTEDIQQVDFSSRPFRLTAGDGKQLTADSIIISTGANARWLSIPGEERLAQSGGGVSACAVCDGALPHFRDKVIAVVGGGDSAMEDALYMTKFASQVLIIHRRDEFRASKIMQERVLANPDIKVLWNSLVEEVIGDDLIERIRIKDVNTGEQREIDVDGMFVAIGHIPNTGFLGDAIELQPNGYIAMPVTWRTETSVPGVFAAGDVMDDFYRQAVTAAGTGCMAALEAERWLAHGGDE